MQSLNDRVTNNQVCTSLMCHDRLQLIRCYLTSAIHSASLKNRVTNNEKAHGLVFCDMTVHLSVVRERMTQFNGVTEKAFGNRCQLIRLHSLWVHCA